ncbi:hypothetical protein HL653_22935 [Sphingomonas sp. AP4-R1]|jgi:predicted neutral ceramidase superfamily lipid hydrolase|uniref:hypothetical protein n=1 Tax=Sphingomonas sp. AP4-R1 TaxID=2735134 RepID=UPI0014936DAB|nr:hypothetical protein [Sphingomonas sp. AP4-R1]QJU60214.1 hypothetical protein HL653_22935 [Sphingomonas sp. AP4-R1]
MEALYRMIFLITVSMVALTAVGWMLVKIHVLRSRKEITLWALVTLTPAVIGWIALFKRVMSTP